MTTDTLTQYFQLRTQLKALTKELNDLLLEDASYSDLKAGVTEALEPLREYRKKLIETSPAIATASLKVTKAKAELKTLKSAIMQSLVLTNKETGEQLTQLSFNF